MPVLIYRVSTSGREVIATLLMKSELGEAFVKHDDGTTRWVPKNWIVEED